MSASAPLVVLRTGDVVPEVSTLHGEFLDLIRASVGSEHAGPWIEFDARQDAPWPECAGVRAFVITGSSSSVTERAPWMLRLEEHLRSIVAEGVPVLGICFGHQILAQALGGLVAKNPLGREIGTVLASRTADDPLLGEGPPTFDVNATHVDTVVTLPPGARVLIRTERDPFAAFALGERVRGVEFHPEMTGDVMRGYVRARSDRIREEGGDAEAVYDSVRDTPIARSLLATFVRRFARPRG